MTTTLTRSKLVTRDIKETMNYTPFGNGSVAVHVHLVVTGIDPFTIDYYAIMSRKKLDAALAIIAKLKTDFPFTDTVKKFDESWSWYFITSVERKHFQSMPIDKQLESNAMVFVHEKQKLFADEKLRQAHRKKCYTNAINKDGANLIRINREDNSFVTPDGELFAVPMLIQHGLRSEEYLMKPMVDYFRTLKNVRLRIATNEWDRGPKDYPELTRVPYYNAEVEGETEITLWILPTDEQHAQLRSDSTYHTGSLHHMMKYDILPVSQFKLVKND